MPEQEHADTLEVSFVAELVREEIFRVRFLAAQKQHDMACLGRVWIDRKLYIYFELLEDSLIKWNVEMIASSFHGHARIQLDLVKQLYRVFCRCVRYRHDVIIIVETVVRVRVPLKRAGQHMGCKNAEGNCD